MDGVLIDCAAGTVEQRALTPTERTAITAAQQAATTEQAARDAVLAPDRADMVDVLANIDAAITAVSGAGGFDGLTAAQRKALMVRVLKGLRLLVRRLAL